jgi:drug/metabolite transporter (DMT)-like permease
MRKGLFYIAMTTVFFSSMEIALKVIANDFNPLQITFTRFFIGGLFLLPFALKEIKRRGHGISRHDVGWFAILGFFCVVLSMTLYQMAIVYGQAAVVATLFSANPVFVAIFAFFILREALTRFNVIALVLEIVGIIFIVSPWNTSLSLASVILALLAAFVFAFYGALGTRQCALHGGVVVTCMSFLVGSLEMLAVIGLGHIPFVAGLLVDNGLSLFANVPLFSGYTLVTLPWVLYVCVGVTGCGYASWFLAMETTSANTASLAFFIKPVLASVLAFLFLGEAIPFNMVIGILIIVIGSAVSFAPTLLAKRTALVVKSDAETH